MSDTYLSWLCMRGSRSYAKDNRSPIHAIAFALRYAIGVLLLLLLIGGAALGPLLGASTLTRASQLDLILEGVLASDWEVSIHQKGVSAYHIPSSSTVRLSFGVIRFCSIEPPQARWGSQF